MAKAEIQFGELGGGISKINGTYVASGTWYRTSSGGLTISTTKKAIGLTIMVNNVWGFVDTDGKFYNQGTYDASVPFTFSDNQIRCTVGWSSSTDYTVKYWIIYGE